MAHLDAECRFQKWVLTPEEMIEGTILSGAQKRCIQNQIAMAAENKIALKYNPEKPYEFVQQEASLEGQISAMQYLLDLSVSMEAQVNQPEIRS